MFVVRVSVPDSPDKFTVMPVEAAATVLPETSTLTVSPLPAPVLPVTVIEVVVDAPLIVNVSFAILHFKLIVNAVDPEEFADPPFTLTAEAAFIV